MILYVSVISDGGWGILSDIISQQSGKACSSKLPYVCKQNLIPVPTTPDPGEGACDPEFIGYGTSCYYVEVGRFWFHYFPYFQILSFVFIHLNFLERPVDRTNPFLVGGTI